MRRSRSIAQYTAIALTHKIKAAGSRGAGEIMVLMFFVILCVVLVVYNCAFIMMYRRSLKLGAHKTSPSYGTTLYGT
jgi:hypothetical protein